MIFQIFVANVTELWRTGHVTGETVELLQRETPYFIQPSLWPPNSPDLTPVDYKIWGLLQELVYATKISSVDELKERISDE